MTQYKAFKTKAEAAAYKKKNGGTIWGKAHGADGRWAMLVAFGLIDGNRFPYVVTKEA